MSMPTQQVGGAGQADLYAVANTLKERGILHRASEWSIRRIWWKCGCLTSHVRNQGKGRTKCSVHVDQAKKGNHATGVRRAIAVVQEVCGRHGLEVGLFTEYSYRGEIHIQNGHSPAGVTIKSGRYTTKVKGKFDVLAVVVGAGLVVALEVDDGHRGVKRADSDRGKRLFCKQNGLEFVEVAVPPPKQMFQYTRFNREVENKFQNLLADSLGKSE